MIIFNFAHIDTDHWKQYFSLLAANSCIYEKTDIESGWESRVIAWIGALIASKWKEWKVMQTKKRGFT